MKMVRRCIDFTCILFVVPAQDWHICKELIGVIQMFVVFVVANLKVERIFQAGPDLEMELII